MTKQEDIIIREFHEKDAEAVCNLIRRNDLEVTSKFYPKELIDCWGRGLTPERILDHSKERICFVAEQNNKVIGYISFSRNEIKKLHVSPDFHKKGIGKMLLEEVEKIAMKNKIDKLILYSNIYAEPFYIKCGFKKINDSWKKAEGIDYKQIYMEKKLK